MLIWTRPFFSPRNAIGYGLHGQAYAISGNHSRAILEYNRALQVKPNYDSADANRTTAKLLQ
ncbi:hypothetical protein [Chamaesiphon polymorphus]|uniref:hypothetical protein n=1 Tax=Chamaesiphon polymorphus TaxID=2107691 RepID=UPI0011B24A6D|nr:hypothetical protein [Chamaesiphon polymorphus]